MARRLPDVALGLALAAAAWASALLVPPVAARLGLDAAASDVQLAVFLGLWVPALAAAAVVWTGAGRPLEAGAGIYLAALLVGELFAGSVLVFSWAPLALLYALAALGWWLTGGLGWRSPASPIALLGDLLDGLRRLFGDELVGVYLYDSAVAGDFDRGRSELDLLVVCAGDVAERLRSLEELHRELAKAHPVWDDRIDVRYVPAAALPASHARALPIAVLCPGEPLHLTETGPEWAECWQLVREHGKALVGPPLGDGAAGTVLTT